MINLIISIIIAIVCGLLGAWGGAENTSKNWRRVGISFVLCIFAYFILKSNLILLWLTIYWGLWGVLSLGYGMPCPNDPKPSKLGAYWAKVFKNNLFKAEIATRATIGILMALCLLSIPIIKGNWLSYTLCTLGLCMVNVIFGGNAIIKNEGMFSLLGKRLLWEEFIIYFALGFYTSSLIL